MKYDIAESTRCREGGEIFMEHNFTEGSIPKKMLRFSIPLVFTNLLQVLFNMADVAVVGRFAGAQALGSVGSTAILVSLFTAFLIGMSGSINVLTALYIGAKNDRELSETIHTGFLISLMEGLVILCLGLAGCRGILMLMNTKPELLPGAVLYMRIYLLGMPALAVYNFGNAVLSADGDTKRPLFYLGFSGIVNIVLNLFFVIVCHLDVAGVALSSIIALYLSAFLVVMALGREKGALKLQRKALAITKDKAYSMLKLGVPAGIQAAIFQFANLFVQAGVNSFDATMVAGNSAATNADGIAYETMASFYTAGATFIGQNYGAGNKKRIWKSYAASIVFSFGIGLLVGFLLELNGERFLSLFTAEADVASAGMKRLKIMGFSYGFSAFMDASIAASRALHKSVIPTAIVILGSCVFRVVWIYTVFAHFQTIPSLYLLYIFSWGITGIAEMIYFMYTYKKIL